MRNLQKSLADQNYVRTYGGDSGLSEHGAVGLGEKIEMVASKIAKPKAKAGAFSAPMAAPIGKWSRFNAGEPPRGRSRSPRDGRMIGGSEEMRRRVSAAAGPSSQPMVYE